MSAADRQPLAVEVISDVVCPWCFIGRRRLQRAIEQAGAPVAVSWRPYQLDPTIPAEGKPRRAYMEGKFGSAERIREVHARVQAAGAEEGIAFAFDRIEVSPNTLDAHRLIRWAAREGLQDAAVEALFRAYFLDGRDIGDRAELAGIAEAIGMHRAEVAGRLASDEDCDSVRGEVAAARRIGVTGVPTFILADRYGLVGAQPAEAIAKALREVAAAERSAPPVPA